MCLAFIWITLILISVNVAGKNFTSALLPGEHQLGMRTRFQHVDDPWLGEASAFTTRLKLTSIFTLDDKESWNIAIEPNYVHAFNDGDYNSVTIQQQTSPIADAENFSWSQVNLQYHNDENLHITVGRQALAFDNERMIGANEFWQTPQRFDAVKLDYNDQVKWHIQYAYSNKVHRIFGSKSNKDIPKEDVRYPQFLSGDLTQRPVNEWGEHRLNSHLLNIHYKTDNNINIVGYGYLLENKDQPWFSSNTVGFRIFDEFKPHQFKYRYTVEYARQHGSDNNPENFHNWYYLLSASIQYKSHLLQLNQEVFSEDNNIGFMFTLGSNHKFQGWADVFNGYNRFAGLRDNNISYKGRKNKLRWRTVWHHFRSYNSNINIGNELDLELAYRLNRQWNLKLRYSAFNAKQGSEQFARVNHDLKTYFISFSYNI